jgi:nitronate monooxygenase
MATQKFRTALCDLLGIEYPIVQSGMGGVAGPEMVAEVSRAGGLGILAGLSVPPEDLRRMIRRVRELTDRPFGVNLWLHPAVRTPVDVSTLPDELVQAVQSALNPVRERLDLPARFGPPDGIPAMLDAAIEVVIDEGVPVFSTALVDRHDAAMVSRCHEHGIKLMTMVTGVADAVAAAEAGVDLIVAQGGEAGGHRSVGDKPTVPELASVSTVSLVPQIVDAVACPVVAAGGLADGRGLVAALALGASGILLGTRFVATRESLAPDFWKAALLESGSETTTITDAFTGLWARALQNRFVQEYRDAGAPVLPPLVQASAAGDIRAAALAQQESDYFPMWSGQSVGLIHDLPGAGEVVQAIVREAAEVLGGLVTRVQRD